jgi:hypothetical protein
MGIIEIAGAIAALVGIFAGIAQVLDYLEKRREKRRSLHEPKEVQQIPAPRSQEYPARQSQDWGEAVDISVFYGRQEELAKLEKWIVTDRCRLVAILGMGGIGKTALSVKLAEQIKDRFDYLLWRSLRNAPPVEEVLGECIQFLSDHQKVNLPENVDHRISLLMDYLRKQRCLLVLDNAEAILQGGDRAGHYREGYEGYGRLLQRVGDSAHQSCLVLTSREKSKEFDPLEGKTAPVRSLQITGLEQKAARGILSDKDLFGAEQALANLIQRYAGNPLALKLVASTIQDVFGGDIARFLEQGTTIFGDVRDLLQQQFERLSNLEQEIMYWLAINREFVSLEELRDDIVHPPSNRELLEALESLRRRSLIERSENAALFTLQAVVMEYVTDRLIEQVCDEIVSEKVALFNSHALIKATAKDYVRESQVRLILKPTADRLVKTLSNYGVESKLRIVLSTSREKSPFRPGYTGGNTINLLVHLKNDLSSFDFSDFMIWQAYLQGVDSHDVNFAHSHLAKSVFTEAFGFIMSIAFSPDGEILAIGTGNGEIQFWQVANGKKLSSCKGDTGWGVTSVAFSYNGRILVSGHQDHTIKLWDANNGQFIKTLEGHTDSVKITCSPDGITIASRSADRTIKLWNLDTGKCLRTLQGHAKDIWTIAFSPNGNILASGSHDGTVRLWDLSTGNTLFTLQGHSLGVSAVEFSPDGNILASAGTDHAVKLWNVNTSQFIAVLQGHTKQVRCIAFTLDGGALVSGGKDHNLKLWNVSTGRC